MILTDITNYGTISKDDSKTEPACWRKPRLILMGCATMSSSPADIPFRTKQRH